MDAARRGVRVFLVVDGVGTGVLPALGRALRMPAWCVACIRAAGHAGAADAEPLAPPAPQAVRGGWPAGVLRRHQCAGRLSRPQPRRAAGAAAGLCGARARAAGGDMQRHHGAAVVAHAGGAAPAPAPLTGALQSLRALRAASVPETGRARQPGRAATMHARGAGAARQRAQPQPHRAGLPRAIGMARQRNHHRQRLLPARRQAAQGAGDGGQRGVRVQPAAAGPLRVLHAVPRQRARSMARCCRPAWRSTNTRPASCTPRWP
jgi:hypothetical protein